MSQFEHTNPEMTENPLPAAMDGETPIQTKLHALRLQQLINLAKAFEIPLPDGATKNEIMPVMAQAERQGVLSRTPKNRYYYLLAHQSPDNKLGEREEEEMQRAIQAAHRDEIKRTANASVRKAQEKLDQLEDEDSQLSLQKRCKELGINSFGMSRAKMEKAIAEKELEAAVAEKQAVEGS